MTILLSSSSSFGSGARPLEDRPDPDEDLHTTRKQVRGRHDRIPCTTDFTYRPELLLELAFETAAGFRIYKTQLIV